MTIASTQPNDYSNFLAANPRRPEDLFLALSERKPQPISPDLASFLRGSNSRPALPIEIAKNIELLTQSGTFAVVTGQQCGLYLGPLFTYYKALSAVLNARSLSATLKRPVVPVFWLQAEDHDYDEVNAIALPTLEETKLTLRKRSAEKRNSLGDEKFGDEITETTARLIELLPEGPGKDSLVTAVRTAFTSGRSWAEAFHDLIHFLFQHDGLVVFNPRAAGASRFLQSTLTQAFEKRQAIESTLHERTKELQNAGLEPQVAIRANSPLFFFHTPNRFGSRYRLEEKDGAFSVHGTEQRVTGAELSSLLRTNPERFSTSALLRPLLQDSLFPTAFYIGGEAEIRYFAQLTPLAPLFDLPAPLIVPRASFLLVEDKARQLGSQLNLPPRAFAEAELEILRKMPNNPAIISPEILKSRVTEHVTVAWEEMRQAFGAVDKTLVQALERSEAKTIEQVNGAITRFEQALLRSDEIRLERVRRAKALLFPNDTMQERVFPAVYYISRYGPRFRELLESGFKPFVGELVEVNL